MGYRKPIRVNAVNHKAPPPQPEDLPLDEAWAVLSRSGFALWTRLHLEPQAVLNQGRRAMAAKLDMPERTFNRSLRELVQAGFVEVVTQTSGSSALHLLRRGALIGATHFVTIQNAIMPAADPSWDHGFHGSGRTADEVRAARRAAAVPLQASFRRQRAGIPRVPSRGTPGLANALNRMAGKPNRAESGQRPSTRRAESGKPERVSDIEDRTAKWAAKAASKPKPSQPQVNEGSPLLLRSLSQKKKLSVEEEKETRVRDPRVELRNAEALFVGARADELREVLRDSSRREAVRSAQRKARAKLTRAFLVIYTAIRRVDCDPGFRRPASTDKATRAAEACLEAGVAPRDMIRYWAERVPEFTSMAFPTLAFLGSDGKADEVKVAAMPKKTRGRASGARGRQSVDAHHAYTADKVETGFEAYLVDRGVVKPGELSPGNLNVLQVHARAVLGRFTNPSKDPRKSAAEDFFRERAEAER